MDNKQKKRILSSVYKATIFFALCAICWIGYFCINNFVSNMSELLWLDITIISISALLLFGIIANINNVQKLKNLYGLAKYIFYIAFITICGVIAGVFAIYYTKYSLSLGYYLTIFVMLFALMLLVFAFVISLKLSKLQKGTSVFVDSTEEVPNYDDELSLKKQLDELTRKKEMKKVIDQIEAIKKELDE